MPFFAFLPPAEEHVYEHLSLGTAASIHPRKFAFTTPPPLNLYVLQERRCLDAHSIMETPFIISRFLQTTK